jgi:nucleoside-diphosphate-sugar epimerase
MKEKIFITGASGCIGHYVIDLLIKNPSIELHLLCRNPQNFKFNYQNQANIVIHIGNLEHIEKLASVIKEMHYVIHIATDWSDSDYATLLNVTKTLKLFEYCHNNNCKKILYFSTASILGKNNKPIKEALLFGPGYIKSKYLAFEQIKQSPVYDKIITLFPTLVLGGDEKHPYSHIMLGLQEKQHLLKYFRWIYLDAAFHFLHAHDIAQVTVYLLYNAYVSKEVVLGNPVISGKKAIAEICTFFKIPIYLRFKISTSFIRLLAKILSIKIDPWGNYCINNPFFKYQVTNPESLGLKTCFPSLISCLSLLPTTK